MPIKEICFQLNDNCKYMCISTYKYTYISSTTCLTLCNSYQLPRQHLQPTQVTILLVVLFLLKLTRVGVEAEIDLIDLFPSPRGK